MGLLNPLLLMLAGAAAVPLLLHLLQRHQGPRVVFPALRYLRRAEKESARRIRLRQIMLMLLRVAAVLLIAFAAARPFVRIGGTGHTPTAVVLILDNSMSSSAVEGDSRVLDQLKSRALEMLAVAGPDDRFWLLRAGVPGEPAFAGDAQETAVRVRDTEPSAGMSDIPATLERARSLLASGADGRAAEIHLLSDLQATAFGRPLAGSPQAPPIVVWHPATAPPAGRAVTAVEAGGGLPPVAGRASSLAVKVEGDSADVDARLHLEDRLVAAGRARPGSSTMLQLPPLDAGIVTGHVEIDADALHADDRRYFVLHVTPPPRIAVIAGTDQSFLEDALDVLRQAGRVERTGVATADLVFAPGAEGLTPASSAAFVILPPSDPTGLNAANRRLSVAGVPWQYGAPGSGARLATGDDDTLLRALEGAQLNQSFPLLPQAGAAADPVLLRLEDGGAWAVRGERENGSVYVLLGSPLTADASTLPTTAAMLPLVDRITGVWALERPTRTDVEPGDEVSLPSAATSVQRPDGTRDAVEASPAYQLGATPGVYRVLTGDSTIAAFASNPPAAESALGRLGGDELRELLPDWPLHVTDRADDWTRAAFRERLGREMWRPLLLALLGVLVLEMIIAASGRGRSAIGTEAATTAETN